MYKGFEGCFDCQKLGHELHDTLASGRGLLYLCISILMRERASPQQRVHTLCIRFAPSLRRRYSELLEKAKADGILSMRKAGKRHYYWLVAPD